MEGDGRDSHRSATEVSCGWAESVKDSVSIEEVIFHVTEVLLGEELHRKRRMMPTRERVNDVYEAEGGSVTE